MEFLEFTAAKDDDGRRIDRILRSIMPESSVPGIYAAIRKRLIRVNRKPCSAGQKIMQGDVIQVASFLVHGTDGKPAQETDAKVPSLSPSDIAFINGDILIVNKKSGISVQPGGKGVSLSEQVVQFYRKSGAGTSIAFTPGPLHRLDRNTSGLTAFSMSLEGAKWFSSAMREHEIKKDYLGLCSGCLESAETWTDFIEDDGEAQNGFHTVKIGAEGEKAVTEAIPLSHSADGSLTLVQFRIQTGKKHQIRCQSAHHGHPLYGDSAYSPDSGDKGQKRFFLHAFRLSFPADNPLSLPEHVTAPIPEDFENFLTLNLIKWDGQIIL